MSGYGWPVTLELGDVALRPLRRRDSGSWSRLRNANSAWLGPWEATPPDPGARPLSYRQMVRRMNRQAMAGESFPWAITVERQLAGQLTVAGVTWGSARTANVGYWVGESFAGHGVVPAALALAVDHCFFRAGLHRIEVNIRPENAASLRVVEKLGFRYEGMRPRFLHIDGGWRDHLSFALVAEEVGPGLVARLPAAVRSPA